MAVSDLTRRGTVTASSDDEIEGLNKRLLESLAKLKFPAPPNHNATYRTRSWSGTNSDNDTDTQSEPGCLGTPPSNRHYGLECSFLQHGSPVNPQALPRYLPPIGVFWDIENCQVPKGRSAVTVTQVIRDKFFTGYREAEFIVVCDVKKENSQVVQELNDAQVNLIHVASTCKNAADEKLRQSIRRFADIHGSPAAIILISGDINFAADLSDLRHRKKIHVILLHKENTSEALILCANEHYNFMELTEPLPSRTPVKLSESHDLLVCNLPKEKDNVAIKRRLKQLSDNCGGRVLGVQSSSATVRFNSEDSAVRAQKRMNGEDVFGSKILVRFPKDKEDFPGKNQGFCAARDSTASESEAVSTPGKMFRAGGTIGGARSLPTTPHYNSYSPIIGHYSAWNGVCCAPISIPPGLIHQTPMFTTRTLQNSADTNYNRSVNELPPSQSPVVWQQIGGTQHFGRFWDEHVKNERVKILNKRVSGPHNQSREAGSAPANGMTDRTPEGMRRIRGTHSHQAQNTARPNYHAPVSSFNGNGYAQSNSFKRRSPSPMIATQARDQNHWNGQSVPVRSSRTPSPYESSSLQQGGQQNSRLSPYHHSDPENEEVENFFNPINHRNGNTAAIGSYTPIELQVTNLDQNIEPKDMKRILSSVFMEHVMVLHVSVFMQSDGNIAASVKVPSLQDAQYAISQLHRRKVGYKRILISYVHTGGPNPQLVRSQIVMLLQEVPGHRLPLFKFREMYESRYMISISVSELYKMKDVCMVTEDAGGRMISLHPDHRNTPSPALSSSTPDGGQVELPYCTIHMQKPWSDKGWAEQEMASLPNVMISLKVLTLRIHQLLKTHNGSLPLPSLPNCYEAEFDEQLEVEENGVPLEHLVSALPCVELKQGVGSVKYLLWVGNKPHDDSHEENMCVSPPLANQISQFSRELVDLLKTAPHCQLSFNRFIPAYHHHFGRQCRVADYGFTKLIDLLKALTHTVQVMGEGNNRVVTLSHRTQVRRFTSDLLRVLKAQASKQVTLSEFPSIYARVITKPWDVVDYGVCEIGDILSEVSENTVVVTNLNDVDKLIAIPKREQTAEEIERTKQFALEVVELLKHEPQCSMLYNKFVPSYHHHFGHQCRVSDYGFTKLIELFEAIPEVVRTEETPGGERRISLTEKEGLKVLGEQMVNLVTRGRGALGVAGVAQAFLRQFGYNLRPELYGCSSIMQLMEKLNGTVKIVQTATGAILTAVDKLHLQQLTLQCRRVMMDQSRTRLPVKDFQRLYSQYYSQSCDIGELEKTLSDVVKLSTVNGEQFLELTPLHCFACNLYRVMMSYGGALSLAQFEGAYLGVIGSACRAAQFGFPTLTALLQALPCTVIVKERRHKKKIIYLNKKLSSVGIPLPSTYSSTSPFRDTDSSSESFDSDSSRLDPSNASLNSEERTKWPEVPQQIWNQNAEANRWQSSEDKNKFPGAQVEQRSPRWPFRRTCSETFLKSLLRTPIRQKGPAPPKPDTPNTEERNSVKLWNSAVWPSPPRFSYKREEHSPRVVIPLLTLPQWNQIGESATDLLSPARYLLPASANPLSPYFSANRSPVVAPHPSELPLPLLPLSPKKSATEVVERSDGVTVGSQTPETDEGFEADAGQRRTPGKQRLLSGKRRLAAQFNQPIAS